MCFFLNVGQGNKIIIYIINFFNKRYIGQKKSLFH